MDEWFIVDRCEEMKELDKVAPKGYLWWFSTIRSYLSLCCFLLYAWLVTLGPHNTTSGHVASPITLFQFQFPYPAGLILITPILFKGDVSNAQYLFKYQIEYILYILSLHILLMVIYQAVMISFYTSMVLFLGCHLVIVHGTVLFSTICITFRKWEITIPHANTHNTYKFVGV